MNKTLIIVSIFTFVLSLMACNNADEPQFSSADELNGQETFIAVYKGKSYIVGVKELNDSVIYQNESFDKIYRENLSKNSHLAMLAYKNVYGQDIIEYFDKEEELWKEYSINRLMTDNDTTNGNNRNNGPGRIIDHILIPEGATLIGRVILYDDVNYKDRSLTIDMSTTHKTEISRLKDSCYKFNDKTSSIRVFNFMDPSKNYYILINYGIFDEFHDNTYFVCVPGGHLRTCLISFEDTNFSGKVLYCFSSYSNPAASYDPSTASHQDWNLKKIGWNDKISAVKLDLFQIDAFNYEFEIIGENGKEPHDEIN